MEPIYLVQWSDPKEIRLDWHIELKTYSIEYAKEIFLTQEARFPELAWILLIQTQEVLMRHAGE